jgi:hypothetical protein
MSRFFFSSRGGLRARSGRLGGGSIRVRVGAGGSTAGLVALVGCVVLAGCPRSSPPVERNPPPSPAADGAREPAGPAASGGLDAFEIDGVWVFVQPAAAASADGKPVKTISLDARASGPPRVIGKCLYVGDAVVVWTTAQVDTLPELVRAARAGVTTPVIVAGGGTDARESGDNRLVPKEIRDRCAAESVWYASGEPE